MNDDNITPTIESKTQEHQYPDLQLALVASAIVILILMIAIDSRYIGLESYGSSDAFDYALDADRLAKMYIFLDNIDARLPKTPAGFMKDADSYRKQAIKAYQKAESRDPSLVYLRKMIILGEPSERAEYIRLLKISGKGKYRYKPVNAASHSEVDMWQDIYLSPAKNPRRVPEYEEQIKKLGLGWYTHLALADLYRLKGGKQYNHLADIELAKAVDKTYTSIIVLGIAALLMMILGLAGIVFIIIYVCKIKRRKHGKEPAPQSALDSMSPSERSYVTGYLMEAFLVYLLSGFLVAMGLMLIFGHYMLIISMVARADIILSLISQVISMGLAMLFLYARMKQRNWSWDIIGINTERIGRSVLWGISGFAALLPTILVAALITLPINKHIPTPPNPIIHELLESNDGISKIIIFIMVAILAPFFEELFFRGVLFGALRARWGATAGIILSSIVFASLHPLPFSFIPIFALGSIFAILSYECKSIIPDILAHSIYNAGIFMILVSTMG